MKKCKLKQEMQAMEKLHDPTLSIYISDNSKQLKKIQACI